MNTTLASKLRQLVKSGKEDECVTLICDVLDMHAEDAQALFTEWMEANYDENGEWVGEE